MGTMRYLLLWSALLLTSLSVQAQMWTGQDTLYGNEWWRTQTSYWRIPISTDGFYRISGDDLLSWGWTAAEQSPGGAWRLYRNGVEQAIYVSQESNWTNADYLEFWGQQNRGELDQYLFGNPEQQQLNPAYSLVNDTASYYLAWVTDNSSAPKRYADLPNDVSNLPPVATHIWRKSEVVFSDQYLKEYLRTNGLTIYHSHYGIAEGYGSRNVNQLLQDGNAPQIINLPLIAPYADGGAPELEVRYGCAMDEHQQQIWAEGVLLYESAFNGWKVEHPRVSLPAEVNWADGLSIESKGVANTRDEASLSVVRLHYPSLPDAQAQSMLMFRVKASPSAQRIEISNFAEAAGDPLVYELSSGQRMEAIRVDGVVRFVWPASSQDVELVLVGQVQGWLSAPSAERRTFEALVPNNTDYVIITDSRLRQGADWVGAYADYRRSAAGGGYRVGIADINDLYEQFAYGVNRHPIAIRNFIHWLKQTPNSSLRYVFMIGKGRDYINLRRADQLAAADGINFFIPAFGYPASDNLLAAGNNYDAPVVALGRLATVSGEEVHLYLNKVQALESQVNSGQTVGERAWMKNVVHLGGGGNAGEQQTIRNNLEQMGRTLEQSGFGAKVNSFYKTSSDPIQTSLSEQIFNRINNGVSIIAFFGHSSPGVFDFNIDNPDNYANAGKYPLMLSLGCFSGDMFVDYRSIGERFMMLEDKGTIAFGASKGFGYIHALYNFARNFYGQMGGAYYGQGIGDGLRASYQAFDAFTDMPHRTLMQQFALNGDPAIRLNPAPGPDYTIDPGSLKFEPSVVSVQSDSFEVVFDLVNLGKHRGDTVLVHLDQSLPSGNLVPLGDWKGAAPPYAQTIRLRLPTQGRTSVGLNTVLLTVDPQNELEELPAPAAELNNSFVRPGGQIGAQLYVVDNNALPVWPPNYALLGQVPITLKASTADALAPERTYVLEVDTQPGFDQPLARTSLTQKGGVLQWTPNINWQDSTVYYWRISPDSLPGSPGYTWEERSFTYINGSPLGWSQSHWGQWQNNGFDRMRVSEGGELVFANNFKDLFIRNSILSTSLDFRRPMGVVNGQTWSDFFRWNIAQSIQIVVIDTLGRLWRNANPGQYGSVNTSTQVAIACFSFPVLTTTDRANIINFIDNVIPPNHLVLVYPAINTPTSSLNVQDWAADSISLGNKNLFNVLESHGATRIRELATVMRPYILTFKKGQGIISELIAENQQDVITTEVSIPGFWSEGNMASTVIGQASSWDSLFWEAVPETVDDTIRLRLYGITNTNQSILLVDSLPFIGSLNLQDISIAEYPSLQLSYFAKDRYETTCPQLKYWRIYYEGYPDLALNPTAGFLFHADTLQQGENLRINMAVENLANVPIDSTWLILSIGQNSFTQSYRIPPLRESERFNWQAEVSTRDMLGKQDVVINLNPDNYPKELSRINNQSSISFHVERDIKTPILHVTFDGQRIMDGDLISANSLINIGLKDENPFLLLKDTSTIDIRLRLPDGQIQRVYFNQPDLRFYPATDQNRNEARIEWDAKFTTSGVYELIIKAMDDSGNLSGALDYQITFEVIVERRISNVLPYPNPFTTAAYFVYTLTGDGPPEDFRIQIMTISGRVVRELTDQDLGALRVGTHKTLFSWDGTDEWGDRLANGIYLYRVMARDGQGEAYKHHASDRDAFFDNGLGKIVILR